MVKTSLADALSRSDSSMMHEQHVETRATACYQHDPDLQITFLKMPYQLGMRNLSFDSGRKQSLQNQDRETIAGVFSILHEVRAQTWYCSSQQAQEARFF